MLRAIDASKRASIAASEKFKFRTIQGALRAAEQVADLLEVESGCQVAMKFPNVSLTHVRHTHTHTRAVRLARQAHTRGATVIVTVAFAVVVMPASRSGSMACYSEAGLQRTCVCVRGMETERERGKQMCAIWLSKTKAEYKKTLPTFLRKRKSNLKRSSKLKTLGADIHRYLETPTHTDTRTYIHTHTLLIKVKSAASFHSAPTSVSSVSPWQPWQLDMPFTR